MASIIFRKLIFNPTCHHLAPLNPSSIGRSKYKVVRSMNSESSQRIFQLKFDPLTGNSEWVVVEEGEDTENSPKALLSSTSYLDMLNDSRRNRAFRKAIEKTVTRACHVLDIGAGTGLLSMMAARAMDSIDSQQCTGSKGMVTACESYLPMVKLMRKVLRVNDMDKKIHIIHKRSDELNADTDLTSRADTLVSEILDSELLGEGLIPTLQHAHDKVLVGNPHTVPYRATTYGQLVECTFLWKLHDLHHNEAKALDTVHLAPAGLETIICAKLKQYAMHCDAISEELRLLSEPFKVFEFDFWKRPESHGQTEIHIQATCDGKVHAIVSWWVLQLDYEGTVFYSTAPKWISSPSGNVEKQTESYCAADWCDHWKQCVWFIPGLGMSVSKDHQVHLQAVHDDTSISYNLKYDDPRVVLEPNDLHIKGCQLTLSPERIGIYGDIEWRSSMLMAVRNAVQKKIPSLCVVADDSVFLTILTAYLSPTSDVISMFPGLREKGAHYLHAVADANGFSMDRLKIIGKRETCLTLEDTNQEKVDLLVGEPFYHGNEAMLPWQNLRFWKERTMIDSVLSKDARIIPCKGILRGCAMSLPDLWRSRRCLETIEGFDHSVVNTTLGACGDLPTSLECPCLPYFIWQCGETKALSEVFTVMEFDFTKPLSPCSGKTKVGFIKSGTCHGFALWIDWLLDADNSIVLSTGPERRYWKQGVKLLSKPVEVGINGSCNIDKFSSTEIEVSFNSVNGELAIKHDFL
ncbi:protein arginine N-methyltransferase 7 [Telopea speciosissima]|uniref:protein arginine N-methyltransferase 7 n=1 Tax=Telopea speciosissima TaxID=54955 RepID=UPI001CC4731C|nr:protein arginine N-methyltransferase 7 [Telopea speciosissima]